MELRKYPVGRIIDFMKGSAKVRRQLPKGKAVAYERPLTGKRRLKPMADPRFPELEQCRTREAEITIEELVQRVRNLLPADYKGTLTEAEYRKFQKCRGDVSASLLQFIGRALGLGIVEVPCSQADLDRAMRDLRAAKRNR
jgi:hypothetical protein